MQYLLESMFYYRTEPITTMFFVSVVAMFGLLMYIFAKSLAEEEISIFLFVALAISMIGFVSGLTFEDHAYKEVTNLEARKFELLKHDDKLEFISKDENLRNATLQIEDETENSLYVRYKDKSFIVSKTYLTERN